MHTFNDRHGGEWNIDLPFGEILRIKAKDSRFDLLEPEVGELGKRLDNDLLLFWELLHIIVEEQATDRGVTAQDFGRLMAGNCLIAAQQAFFREWIDFFHHIQRPDVATALEVILQLNIVTAAKVKERMASDQTIKNLPAIASEKLDSVLTTAFKGLQESCDWTLSDTPTERSGSETKA
ncbi:hypothetical protein [Anatilimnocola floriformis]|uniref:hypothetical protein n=1 Tax=Anatilimnocola floriformis TaxID=2948575 RepID=UPI0020C45F6A|nr:hypothetical protein [Anatilimnocola floriformis]